MAAKPRQRVNPFDLGNSVCPAMSEALCRANLLHDFVAEGEAA